MSTTPQDPLARLAQAVIEYDAKINAAERAPTGDDYNALYSIVRGMTLPLPSTAPKEEPRAPTVYECQDPFGVGCDWTGTMDEVNGIHHIHHIHERLEPGELVPAGCCPECNSILSVDDRDVPHHTLYGVGLIMRQRGWTVAAPAGCPSLDTIKGE